MGWTSFYGFCRALSKLFIHVSAAKCWEMVRERVNQEIMKQHKLGRMRLPPLQPHGSLDGFEMFDFFSPAILQVIQAMDQNQACTEYWKSHPQMQIPQHFQYQENGQKLFLRTNVANVQEASNSQGVDAILSGLFEKANPEELHALHSIVSDNMSTADQNLMTRLLNREIQKRWRLFMFKSRGVETTVRARILYTLASNSMVTMCINFCTSIFSRGE